MDPQEPPSPTGPEIRVFVAADKSPKNEKFEIRTGAMARVIRRAMQLPEDSDRVFARKRMGIVNVDWVFIFSLELPNDKDVVLMWDMPELE